METYEDGLMPSMERSEPSRTSANRFFSHEGIVTGGVGADCGKNRNCEIHTR